MTAVPVRGQFDIGRVIKNTFGAIVANLGVFSGLVLIALGVTSVIVGAMALVFFRAFGPTFDFGANPDRFSQAWPILFAVIPLAWVVVMAAFFVLQASIIHGVVAYLNGRKATLGECLSTGARHWLALLLLAIILGLGEAVGFILLIVPGVLLALAWSVAIPVRVVERRGVLESISRSADLTRGKRGAILGLAVLYYVASSILQQVVSNLITAAAFTGPAAQAKLYLGVGISMLSLLVLSFVSYVVVAAGSASIYYELRSIKEGIGVEALASVFD